jgi:ABC-type Fe3+ transport system substrate-binding protein
VKAEDAPKIYAELLDPRWSGKMVKGHPAYSGTIMTATFQQCAISAGTISKNCRNSM